jgi:hypothetical protein
VLLVVSAIGTQLPFSTLEKLVRDRLKLGGSRLSGHFETFGFRLLDQV